MAPHHRHDRAQTVTDPTPSGVRLQPSLLDRLTDDEPEKKVESRDKRTLSLRRLRDIVLRDLSWLLNTNNLGASESLEAYPYVAKSVLNYGTPDLTGITVSSLVEEQVERLIHEAIQNYEPRLLRNRVTIHTGQSQDAEHNLITLEIDAELWGEPVSQELFLKTEIDLESGHVRVSETLGRSSS